MPDKHVWMTEAALSNLRALATKWGLSDSATIAEALRLAAERK